MLTLAQIQAAQANDLDAIRTVLDAMDSRINRLANQAAAKMGSNPARHADYVEDFRQDALVALFEALPAFDGTSADGFYAFMYRSMETVLKARYNSERNQGADRDAMWVFKEMVERADGDLALAEKLSQTVPPKGRRLSADRAYAARMAWQGPTSLDAPRAEDASLLDTLVAPVEAEAEIRPKVGHGAALEALSVLHRYAGVVVQRMTPGDFSSNLPTLVEFLEGTVRVPSDPTERRYVLDAMAILRSAVSTTADGDLSEDLRTAADDRADDRATKVATVRAVLGAMGEGQRAVLVHTFGIGDAHCYGSTADDVLAKELGTTPQLVQSSRKKGLRAFAKRYIKAVATSEAHAEALTDAVARNLARK